MVGCFHAVPVINDWQSFDQKLSEIESSWENFPANGGINFAEKSKCLERLAMLIEGNLLSRSNLGPKEALINSSSPRPRHTRDSASRRARRGSSTLFLMDSRLRGNDKIDLINSSLATDLVKHLFWNTNLAGQRINFDFERPAILSDNIKLVGNAI